MACPPHRFVLCVFDGSVNLDKCTGCDTWSYEGRHADSPPLTFPSYQALECHLYPDIAKPKG